ncbi:hypothetical protein L7F22_004913 [Adiantum nelumboides]|nr:hypothetical protein [Adiantum nelumboides]
MQRLTKREFEIGKGVNINALEYQGVPMVPDGPQSPESDPGVVGRLKIQVPWKKLGREPILIGLQDIYICACPRDEFEWKSEALEARSSAAKKAKLAAAELAKLSARISGHISDDHSNQSFFSYLSTKILDNIQVTAENVHFRYMDQKTDPEMAFSFGIKFSHLTLNTEQTFIGVAGPGRARPNLGTKVVDIKDFCIYWNSDEDKEKDFLNNAHLQIECTHLINPFNASLRFMINKSSLFDGSTPQYSTAFEINKLDFTLQDRQLHEMLLLWDALATCQMREK